MTQEKFLNETSFQLKIESMVKDDGLSYLEAIIKFCDDNDMDPEDVKKLLTVNLKGKLKLSAMAEGYMKQESVLPI